MMKRHKKLYRAALSVLMRIALWAGLPSAPASADAEMRRTVIGADLDEAQIETVYRSFGIERGTVPELRLTNAEERAALAGSLDEAVIGTRAISCVYFELLPEGSGLLVRTENISFCTAEMYRNSLRTAGINDAKLIVAAPFSVSGTAAMAGVYKAYEDMTGETLNTEAKTAGTQELTITGELADELGSDDSAQSIIGELKAMLSETAGMTDDEDIIAAAVLHDVVEDTGKSEADIREAFGDRVADLVMAESEDKMRNLPPEASWELRKQATIDHLAGLERE